MSSGARRSHGPWAQNLWGVEDVVSVLTLVRRGVAQVFHVLRVELRGQLVVGEEEEGKEDGQEEKEEVESGEGRVKERQPCG